MRILIIGLLLLASTTGSARTLLVLGDSISAAHGIDKHKGWVTLLEKRLESDCPAWRVKNASVSGETSAGGAVRLEGLLARNSIAAVLIELGGNDGLRGLPPKQLRKNLEKMIRMTREAGARVGLLGIRVPPNYGAAYTSMIEQSFRSVAEEADVAFVPRILDGVASRDGWMQDDGIHPTAEAQPRLLDNAWPVVEQLLDCVEPD
jgi:acyl-CoA thioesterase-1